MIVIGFIEIGDKNQALEIFNEICIKKESVSNTNLYNSKNNSNIMSINLTYKDFFNEKYNFTNFDIVVFESLCFAEELKRKILNIISVQSILIINCDDKKIFKFLKGSRRKIITYGLNNKSCITASSIQDNEDILQELQCCIQRIIPTFSNNKIEPQEFKVILKKYRENDIYNSLAAVSASLICDIQIENFKKITL